MCPVNKKKILFISNISKRITNFSIPSILAGQSLGYEFHLAANYSGFTDDPTKYNVTLHHIDLVRNPFSLRNIVAYRQMVDLIAKEKFQVIHCNTPIGGVLGRLCGNKLKVPKIMYTVHGFHFYQGAPLLNRTFLKWAEMWLARYTDAIITINHEDYRRASVLNLRGKGRAYYVPGVGVDTSCYLPVEEDVGTFKASLGLQRDDIVLIAMGELGRNKNYTAAIRSLAQAANPRVHFLICGTGPESGMLQKLTKALGVENRVQFLGYRKDIKELLMVADMFCLTSFREGLSRSIMEAMSAGLPCLVSKIRGNVDLITEGKGGCLRGPNDIKGFAEAINSLATEEKLRTQMGRYNRKKIKQFDVENVKRIMKEIYCEVLGEKMH
jgi:glycosyltransferase involved in cell wall biosynthesis